MFIGYIFSFLALGLWLALKARKKNLLPVEFLYIGSLAASLSIYYFVFYIYILNRALAHAVVILFMLAALACVFSILKTLRSSKQTAKTVGRYYAIPLIITVGFLAAYSVVFYSCVSRQPALGGYKEIDNRTFCHTAALPFDNALPYIYGENILHNEEKAPIIDWSLADRPPLQIAATMPILDFSGGSSPFTKFTYYHIFSVFLQLGWIGAIWGILQGLKIKKRYQALTIIGFSVTGFFYLNSVFVWPKLLAASVVLSGVMLFLGKSKNKLEFNYLPFATVLLALGLLSHAGVLFTIIPFGIFMAYRIFRRKDWRKKINLLYITSALLVAITLLAPWYAYKATLVKADRLVKWHFAGVQDLDQRGTVETLVKQYRGLSFSSWLSSKEDNLKTVATGNYSWPQTCSAKVSSFLNKCLFNEWRTVTFFSTLFAFEAFNLGWLAFIYRLVKGKLDRLDVEIAVIATISLLFWVVAMFLPASTIVHQGSYATMMLVFLLLAKNLAALPLPFFSAIVLSKLSYFMWLG